jgi:bifunctional UDP-N-acetylglucosamine pyrophosphorylase/glucosamine-1-phosphate N-acetyltransferase
VEERDATTDQRKIQEINTGIYCCACPFLFEALKKVGSDNDQGEYYLPDIVALAAQEKKNVYAFETNNIQEVKGVNDRIDLAEAEKAMRQRIVNNLMREGVTIINPDATYIDFGVTIGQDTVIFPNTVIRGGTVIGENCSIETSCTISDSIIGNGVHIKSSSVIEKSYIKDNAILGPFARIRPETTIDEEAKIGNFVEVKKSHIGKGSKVNHLAYIGDTTIGRRVNIGAGTITCNYDGKRKHATIIEDNVFVGSNTALVAPLKVGKGSVIAAGSTITKDIPDGSVSATRIKQINYDNWFEVFEKSKQTNAKATKKEQQEDKSK